MNEVRSVTATDRAEIIRVRIEEDQSGLFFATSPDLVGLVVAEPDLESLHREIPNSIKLLFKAQGIEMEVLPARRTDEGISAPWVAIPAHLAA